MKLMKLIRCDELPFTQVLLNLVGAEDAQFWLGHSCEPQLRDLPGQGRGMWGGLIVCGLFGFIP